MHSFSQLKKGCCWNLQSKVNLCLCFHLTPTASPGCSGRPSGVVRGQSHAGKLDWRVFRLLFWFQTQGKFGITACFLFIHHPGFLSISGCPPSVAPSSRFLLFISSFPSTDCCFSPALFTFVFPEAEIMSSWFAITAVCSNVWCHNQAFVSLKHSRAALCYVTYFRAGVSNSNTQWANI